MNKDDVVLITVVGVDMENESLILEFLIRTESGIIKHFRGRELPIQAGMCIRIVNNTPDAVVIEESKDE